LVVRLLLSVIALRLDLPDLLGVDLAVQRVQLIHNDLDMRILGFVRFVAQDGGDALSVEGMHTRENVELTIEDGRIAYITTLRRVDRDVLIPLVALLVAQLLGVVRILLDCLPQGLNLRFVILKTLAQMFFHVLDAGFFWELFQ